MAKNNDRLGSYKNTSQQPPSKGDAQRKVSKETFKSAAKEAGKKFDEAVAKYSHGK